MNDSPEAKFGLCLVEAFLFFGENILYLVVLLQIYYIVSPARNQKHRKINVQRPFYGIIAARKPKDLGKKPCTCRRPENV